MAVMPRFSHSCCYLLSTWGMVSYLQLSQICVHLNIPSECEFWSHYSNNSVYPYIPMPSVQTMNVGKHDDVSLGWPVGQCVCDVCRRAVLSSTNTPAKLLPSKLLFPPTPATPPPSPALRDTELHTIFANMTNGTFCSLLTETNLTKIAPFAHFQSQSMTGSFQNLFRHDRRKYQLSGFS